MKHIFYYLAVSLLVLGCGNNKKEAKTEIKSEPVESTSISTTEFGKTNYAVVWNWTTSDEKLVSDNTIQISKELTELWKKGVVENVYYDSESKADKLGHFPNISFFLKAKSEEEAKSILNKLTIVKKGISQYKIHLVGSKWLGRNEDAISKTGIKKTWVAVWSTGVDHNSKASKEEVRENAKAQSDAVISLWDKGIVENAYLDILGVETKNNVTDFVLFVNANSEQEAHKVLDNLPFSKKNIAHYQLFPVGVFWMGTNEQN